MRNLRPHTAEQAKHAIESIVEHLPSDERERIVLFGENVLVDAPKSAFWKMVVNAIATLPEKRRRSFLFAIIQDMPEAKRRKFLRVMQTPRDWMLGLVMVEQKDFDAIKEVCKLSVSTMCKAIRDNRELKKKSLAGPRAKQQRTRQRNEAIKELLDKGYLKSQIYEILREQRPELMKGAKKRTGVSTLVSPKKKCGSLIGSIIRMTPIAVEAPNCNWGHIFSANWLNTICRLISPIS